MSIWPTLTEWGQRLAVVTGLATPIYGGLAYFQLAPVTQSYVTDQLSTVRKDITASRVDTLETKRVVLGVARNDLVRERQALEGAMKTEKNPVSLGTWNRRLETIGTELGRIDRTVSKLDDTIEDLKTK